MSLKTAIERIGRTLLGRERPLVETDQRCPCRISTAARDLLLSPLPRPGLPDGTLRRLGIYCRQNSGRTARNPPDFEGNEPMDYPFAQQRYAYVFLALTKKYHIRYYANKFVRFVKSGKRMGRRNGDILATNDLARPARRPKLYWSLLRPRGHGLPSTPAESPAVQTEFGGCRVVTIRRRHRRSRAARPGHRRRRPVHLRSPWQVRPARRSAHVWSCSIA